MKKAKEGRAVTLSIIIVLLVIGYYLSQILQQFLKIEENVIVWKELN